MVWSDKFRNVTEFEAFDIQHSTVSDLLSATGSVDIVNVSEVGILIGIGVVVSTVATGTPTSRLEITIDGGTTRNIGIYAAFASWDKSGFAGLINHADGQIASGRVSDSGFIPIHSRYAISLRVAHNVTVAGSAGQIELAVLRGVKL